MREDVERGSEDDNGSKVIPSSDIANEYEFRDLDLNQESLDISKPRWSGDLSRDAPQSYQDRGILRDLLQSWFYEPSVIPITLSLNMKCSIFFNTNPISWTSPGWVEERI